MLRTTTYDRSTDCMSNQTAHIRTADVAVTAAAAVKVGGGRALPGRFAHRRTPDPVIGAVGSRPGPPRAGDLGGTLVLSGRRAPCRIVSPLGEGLDR